MNQFVLENFPYLGNNIIYSMLFVLILRDKTGMKLCLCDMFCLFFLSSFDNDMTISVVFQMKHINQYRPIATSQSWLILVDPGRSADLIDIG